MCVVLVAGEEWEWVSLDERIGGASARGTRLNAWLLGVSRSRPSSHLDGIVKGGGWRLLYFEWFELDFDVNRNKRRHTQHDAKHTIARTAPHPAPAPAAPPAPLLIFIPARKQAPADRNGTVSCCCTHMLATPAAGRQRLGVSLADGKRNTKGRPDVHPLG